MTTRVGTQCLRGNFLSQIISMKYLSRVVSSKKFGKRFARQKSLVFFLEFFWIGREKNRWSFSRLF
jgi:hypothetical protein